MEEKACTLCKEIKKLTDYSFRDKKKGIRTERCKDCTNQYAGKYREENRPVIRKKQNKKYKKTGWKKKKEYDKKNAEHRKIYEKMRYATDPEYRMKKILRSRFAKVLKGKKKSKTVMKYIVLDLSTMRKWFEFQFDDLMTWENQGTYWDVEHVIPCCAFTFSESDLHKCWHWSNLRPLSKTENREKYKTVDQKIINEHKKIIINFQLEYICGTK